MKKIAMAVFIAMVIASCAKEEKSENAELEQITLSATFAASPSTEIKPEHQTESRATATAFESGDELGLFVVRSGMEVQSKDNLVNNHKMVVGSDGVIKGTPTAVYYPTSSSQTTSPTSLYSYYPYQSGDATADALGVLVGIRTDQTDFLDVKRSDLCFGSLDNAEPSKTAKVITFRHSFAQVRVNVTLYNGCPAVKQLRLINVKDSATLNMQTGAISLKQHTAEILAYKSAENSYSTIIPAQTLNGACIAIDLVDNKTTYIYNAITPINLTQSATNTLNLTINDKGVASLNGTPSVTAWTTATSSGMMNSAINNQISLYWLAPHSDYATADKITLSTTDPLGVTREIDLTPTLDPTSSSSYAIYKFDLKIDSVTYPLTINKVQIYKSTNLLSECPDVTLSGKVLHRLGAHVIATQTNRIKINNLWWAVGNLVANGENGCKIGAPTDGGLYFQLGSLIGWKGGATGDGTGRAAKANNTFYGGSSFNANNEYAVYPAGYQSLISNIGTKWPNQVGTNLYYFGYDAAPYATDGTNIQDYPGFLAGSLASSGVGDPCRYYLGDTWRMPTYVEARAMHDAATNKSWPGSWANTSTDSYMVFTFSGGAELRFPAVGRRHYDAGCITAVGDNGWCWSSLVNNSGNGYTLNFYSGGVNPQSGNVRRNGFPVRCVDDGVVANISISPAGSWSNVANTQQSRTITVTTAGSNTWTAEATGAGLSVSPTSGTSGQTATITWAAQAYEAAARSGSVKFSSGAATPVTVATNQLAGPPLYITINGLKWTIGNLVADGANDCKIGAPGDGGLYFQFGSLIGWKGGASGNGTGRPAKANNTFYSGSSFNASSEVQVVPTPFTTIGNIGTTWPNQSGTNLYYFGYNTAPYATDGTNIQDYPGFLAGSLASSGVGDPCRYYLGDTWRMPTHTEINAMYDAATSKTYPGSWTNGTSTDSYMVFTFPGGTELRFPAVGLRHNSYNGAIYSVGDNGYFWSSSVYSSGVGYFLSFYDGGVKPQGNISRRFGFPVRCVDDGVVANISISPAGSWSNVANTQQSRTITVTTTGSNNWTAEATGAGLSVTPTSGTSGQTATITWAAQAAGALARSGSVTFSSGSATPITITTNQVAGPAPTLSLSATAPGVTVPMGGGTYYVNVASNAAWTATTSYGSYVSISPTSGTGNVNSVRITVATTSLSTTRPVNAVFRTSAVPSGATATQTWSGTQAAGPANAVNINGTWWSLSNTGAVCNWDTALTRCVSPWRLPSKDDAEALIASGRAKEVLGYDDYWSSTEIYTNGAYYFVYNGTAYTSKYDGYDVRCVQ